MLIPSKPTHAWSWLSYLVPSSQTMGEVYGFPTTPFASIQATRGSRKSLFTSTKLCVPFLISQILMTIFMMPRLSRTAEVFCLLPPQEWRHRHLVRMDSGDAAKRYISNYLAESWVTLFILIWATSCSAVICLKATCNFQKYGPSLLIWKLWKKQVRNSFWTKKEGFSLTISDNNTLVYKLPQKKPRRHQLAWLGGSVQEAKYPERGFVRDVIMSMSISPDQSKVAFSTADANSNQLWVHSFESSTSHLVQTSSSLSSLSSILWKNEDHLIGHTWDANGGFYLGV